MEVIIKYSPIILIGIYLITILITLIKSNQIRGKVVEAHREDSPYSWTRMMGTFLVVSAVIIAFVQLLMGEEMNITLISAMLTIAFGGKIIQKKNENGESVFTFDRNKKDSKDDNK